MKNQLLLFSLLFAFVQQSPAQWVLDSLAFNKGAVGAAAYQDKVYFIGGSIPGPYPFVQGTTNVSVYNCATSSWDSSLVLSLPRYRIACVAGDSGVYAFGGVNTIGLNVSGTNIVDIFKNGTLHTDTISDHLFYGTGVKVGNQLIFAGFADSINSYTSEIFASDKVYIYNEITGKWNTSRLSSPRTMLAAASDGILAIFAGGLNHLGVASDVVDIYNSHTGVWTTAKLSSPRGFIRGTYCNGKFYFAGGTHSGVINYSSDVVDVYDGNNWSTLKLSVPRCDMAIAAVGNNVYFMGGGDIDLSLFYLTETYATVDVLNTETGEWSRMDMEKNLATYAYATSGNKIVLGGGRLKPHLDGYLWAIATKYVQILDVSTVASQDKFTEDLSLEVYPNPSGGMFTVSLPYNEGEIFIIDMMGNEISRTQTKEKNNRMQLDTDGIYLVSVKTKHGVATQKLIVVK
jgi:hypothetical protein